LPEDPYLQQAQCAIRLVSAFLDELRGRGRYDDATVIVHADTGLGIGKVGKSPPAGRRSTLGVADRALRDGVQALLMIKRPHRAAPLQVSAAPTQLVDLFPTVLDVLGLTPDYPVDGRSVYTLAPGAPRDVRFGLDPARKYGHDFVEVRIDDPTDLDRSGLTVVGPASDPRTWPAGARP
jgi:arylsulfatase A-like enzyme